MSNITFDSQQDWSVMLPDLYANEKNGGHGRRTLGILVHLKKAFDLVDHNLLIEKFIHIGVRRSIGPWFCDFLSNLMQCVRFNSTPSDFATLSAGLPCFLSTVV